MKKHFNIINSFFPMQLHIFENIEIGIDGVYEVKSISKEDAISLFNRLSDNGTGYRELWQSSVKNDQVARLINTVLHLYSGDGALMTLNTYTAKMRPGDVGIVFKPIWNGRSAVGFDYYTIKRLNGADTFDEIEQSAVHAGAAPITGTLFKYAV